MSNDLSPSNVVLTGFMGTGKSTVGRIVAVRLGYQFVDTDDVIEQRHGPIESIFAERGEAAFRQLERDLANELAGHTGQVIATGGRMMLDQPSAAALEATGRVVCLVAGVEDILARVLADPGSSARPLLAVDDPRQRILDLLAEREEGYRRFLQVSTTGCTPEQVAGAVIEIVAA